MQIFAACKNHQAAPHCEWTRYQSNQTANKKMKQLKKWSKIPTLFASKITGMESDTLVSISCFHFRTPSKGLSTVTSNATKAPSAPLQNP
jgi:hypothetical protein